MMWIGAMKDCPLDLAAQGQLLKQGTVRDRKDKKDKDKVSSCHLFLFKQCLVLCKSRVNKVEPGSILSNCGRARDAFTRMRVRAFMGTNAHESFTSMLMEASRAQCWSTIDMIWAKIIKGQLYFFLCVIFLAKKKTILDDILFEF